MCPCCEGTPGRPGVADLGRHHPRDSSGRGPAGSNRAPRRFATGRSALARRSMLTAIMQGSSRTFGGYYRPLELIPGPHAITIVAPDFDPLMIDVVIVPGRTTTSGYPQPRFGPPTCGPHLTLGTAEGYPQRSLIHRPPTPRAGVRRRAVDRKTRDSASAQLADPPLRHRGLGPTRAPMWCCSPKTCTTRETT